MKCNEHPTMPAPKRTGIERRYFLFAVGASLVATGWMQPAGANVVTEWNALAMSCITRAGPTTAFDVALVQAAVHDAVQAIEGKYEPYLATPPAAGTESKAAAAAAAAYRVLSDDRICPENAANTVQATLDTAFAPYLAGNDPGLVTGNAAAAALLAEYRPSTTTIPLPYVGNSGVGQWRPTPPGNQPMAFVFAATTKPFVITSPTQFRPGPPPAMTSQRYKRDYDEVKETGSVTAHPAAGACPAPGDTDKARFWAGNFGVQWNQALRDIAVDRQLSIGETARLLALANLAAADAGIAVWDAKIAYNFWRPSTAIQNGDADPNPQTTGDPGWTPFIQSSHFPAGSQNPAYPDYVSGANGLTGAYTAMLQLFFGTDFLPLEIYKASPATVPICTNPRLYRRISDAAQEVVDARVLLGIHFRFADTEARSLGTRIAFYTFARVLRPVRSHWQGHDSQDD